jgi:hypothetical protein
MSQQTTNRSFDELARAMAEGSLSRRRVLKLFAGTALAALIPSRALADDDCVRVCHVPFDRETEECDFANAQTRCVSRRERRRHLENHPCDCRGRCANCLASTTTSTTSTSTSTTSTSTTPMCISNGGSCSANNQCCSGRCAGGMCAEPCPSGTVTLSNGTCAKLCTGNAQVCTGANCFCLLHVSDQAFYCGSIIGASRVPGCMDDSACPPGEFCRQVTGPFPATECLRAC